MKMVNKTFDLKRALVSLSSIGFVTSFCVAVETGVNIWYDKLILSLLVLISAVIMVVIAAYILKYFELIDNGFSGAIVTFLVMVSGVLAGGEVGVLYVKNLDVWLILCGLYGLFIICMYFVVRYEENKYMRGLVNKQITNNQKLITKEK